GHRDRDHDRALGGAAIRRHPARRGHALVRLDRLRHHARRRHGQRRRAEWPGGRRACRCPRRGWGRGHHQPPLMAPRPRPGPVYVGLDGGGTRTTVLVTDAAGAELARVEGEAGIVDAREPAARATVLRELVLRALERAGAAPPAAALCCALAGAGREPGRRALRAALEPLGIARAIRIVGDGEAAFHDAFGAGPGILLIAGTGSIAWGRAADGRTARAGGWGQALGDEGSGYALGL